VLKLILQLISVVFIDAVGAGAAVLSDGSAPEITSSSLR
jgi:hypothetical protein